MNDISRYHMTFCETVFAGLLVLSLLVCSSGCTTLAALGLPFGSSANNILDSAKSIAAAPGSPILAPKELQKCPLDQYLIEMADTLFVEPVSFDATIRLPGDQIVKPDGMISLGEFGDHHVVGKTVEQIRVELQAVIDQRLRTKLQTAFDLEEQKRRAEDDQIVPFEIATSEQNSDDDISNDNAERGKQLRIAAEAKSRRDQLQKRIAEQLEANRITVRLVNWDSKKIYVLGEVNSPGFYPFNGNETVLDAILEAGGVTARSNHHQIIVSRPTPCGSCRIVMQVCYDQIVQLGDSSTNYQLMPGDRVFVPSLTFKDDLKKSFRLGGEQSCPRCSSCPTGCPLPTGCE